MYLIFVKINKMYRIHVICIKFVISNIMIQEIFGVFFILYGNNYLI